MSKDLQFMDFECTQETMVQWESGYVPDLFEKCSNCLKYNCEVYGHEPNWCIAHKVCTLCKDKDKCEYCGQMEYIFKEENTAEECCEWLFVNGCFPRTILRQLFSVTISKSTIRTPFYNTCSGVHSFQLWCQIVSKSCVWQYLLARLRR